MKEVVVLVIFLGSCTAYAQKVTDDLMSKKIEESRYDTSKDHFNSHRILYRDITRKSVVDFVSWCFSGNRVKKSMMVFKLNGLKEIFDECFNELNQLKCTESSESHSCKLKLRFLERKQQAELLQKILKDYPITEKGITAPRENNSQVCKNQMKQAEDNPSERICFQALVTMLCHTGEAFTARNSCVANDLVQLGWKRVH